METNDEVRWVAERLASLEPKWTPSSTHARGLLEARLQSRLNTNAWISVAVTAALLVAIVAIPETRMLAQKLWYRLVLNRVDVLRVDLSNLPLRTEITSNGLEETVVNIDQAEQKVGFKPILPPADVLPNEAQLRVIGPISVKQTVNVGDLKAALAKVGAYDVQVPAEWEGVSLRAEIGPMLAAEYPGEIQILQAKPIEMFLPSGFPLDRFAETVFRSIGISSWEARELGRRFVAHPAWFLDIPVDEPVNLQEVSLRKGRALLVEDVSENGAPVRATVLYSTPDRMYSVSSNKWELSMRIANAIP